MITISDLRRLFEQSNEPILSLYLVVDPALAENQAAMPGWRNWLKTALKDLEHEQGNSECDGWFETREQLEAFLESYSPNARTLVVFCGKTFVEAHEFPVIMENYIAFGEPALTPLFYIVKRYKPYLLTFAERETIRVWLVGLDGIQYQDQRILEWHRDDWREMTIMPATSSGGLVKSGSHRDRFAQRMDEQLERFCREAAQQVLTLAQKHHIEYVVLAGNDEATHRLRRCMTDQTIIGPVSIAHYLRPSEVLKQVAVVVAEYEQEQEQALVDETLELAKSGGRAALGMDVLTALEQRCVELLLVPWSASNQKFVDKMTLEALAQGADVRPVSDEAADHLVGECGVAARLYYRNAQMSSGSGPGSSTG